ncbi:SRPBCC family protein [Acidicapsa ligni]|uniref:SRPBCC family protein n=1 Tax=Acidicapsa ligni TaxID=542300 RepID=UPI0021E03A68|nr:SRPBCC domain-containing protein [Acidicapsa ligni]
MSAAMHQFTIERHLHAPRELVFSAWTEKHHLMHWFGPKGVTIPIAEMDLRPGGTFLFCMRMPDGVEMWGKWVFREIVPPEQIVLINSFSNADGELTRHPFADQWPLQMLSTTHFAEHNGGTTIRLKWSPIYATDAEIQSFDAGHESMKQGWTGTFDQLAAYLATI